MKKKIVLLAATAAITVCGLASAGPPDRVHDLERNSAPTDTGNRTDNPHDLEVRVPDFDPLIILPTDGVLNFPTDG